MSVFKAAQKFNQEVIGINRNTVSELDRDERDWLVGALMEEIDEFLDAYNKRDIVEQIDALIDLIYFAAGGLTRMGLSYNMSEAIFDVIHECNMQKIVGKKERRVVVSKLDAIKPVEWAGPNAAIMDILNEGLRNA